MPERRPGEKSLRADARRNRASLIAAAREAFAAGELDLRMEALARRAGVGIGTVYRHFPTRDALIEAVYRAEVDRLCAAADTLLAEHPPDEALRRFLEHLVAHLAANLGLARALGTEMVASGIPRQHGDEQVLQALTALMSAARCAGRIRSDIRPETVALTLSVVCIDPEHPQWSAQAAEVIALIMDGLRATARP
ncbi:MAG: TetR/AcrR family transcriptional regulator [Alphaproteobacteria bacterium]|nr:TetR/AcrR family transcriptional regulator [Alphaproteobacteria bacterium]